MAVEYTKEVLKKRIEQSEYILHASSDKSAQSTWENFELKYAASIEKAIKVLILTMFLLKKFLLKF